MSSTTTTYHHQDHLSNRLVTSNTGSVVEQLGQRPYGEDWYDTGSEKWKFTTCERDAESTNDYAKARFHVNRLGRFSSPDPQSGFLADPQSLNHFPYVGNDPINMTDPTGRDDGFYQDPNCDVHITNVNPFCPSETDCAGELSCGANGDPGGGTTGGGGGGLGPLDPTAGGQPSFASCQTDDQGQVIASTCTMELGSFPNPSYDFFVINPMSVDSYGNEPTDPKTGKLIYPGVIPFGSNYGASFDNWAQPVTTTQVPAFRMFFYLGSSSSGPTAPPVVRLPSPSGGP